MAAVKAVLTTDRWGTQAVWIVRLATLQSPDQVLQEVANVLGARHEADQLSLEAIAHRLDGRGPTLVILDNLEHLLPAAPQLARARCHGRRAAELDAAA